MQVAQQPVALHHYLKQPRRLVYALMSPDQVEELSPGKFRLTLRAIRFLMLNIYPVVDLSLETLATGRIRIRSTGCRIAGNEFINQRFQLSLSGILDVTDLRPKAQVTGCADLAIAVELPPMLSLTPYPLLEATGNQILKGILVTMKQRMMRQLSADYERWSVQASQQVSPRLTVGAAAGRASCLDS